MDQNGPFRSLEVQLGPPTVLWQLLRKETAKSGRESLEETIANTHWPKMFRKLLLPVLLYSVLLSY